MLKANAKWLNAREKALAAITPECWEYCDKANCLIHYDDLRRVYIVDNPEFTEEFKTAADLIAFCRENLVEINRMEWWNGLTDIEKALLRGRM